MNGDTSISCNLSNCDCDKPKAPHALTREQEVARALQRLREDPFRLGTVEIMGMIYDEWTNLSRIILSQQAQELERLKVDAQLGRDLCAILQNHVGETGLSEGAVEVLKRKLQQLAGAERERDAAVSVCDDFKRGFGEARQQLAAMTEERDEARAEERQEREDKVKWQHKCSLVPFWVFDYLNKKIPVMTIPEQLAASQARARELEERLVESEKAAYDVGGVIDHLKATLAEREAELNQAKGVIMMREATLEQVRDDHDSTEKRCTVLEEDFTLACQQRGTARQDAARYKQFVEWASTADSGVWAFQIREKAQRVLQGLE